MAFSGPSAGFTTQEFEGGTFLGDRLCCGECFRMVVSWIDEVFQTQICVVIFILHMLQSEHDCASNNTDILYWLIKHLPIYVGHWITKSPKQANQSHHSESLDCSQDCGGFGYARPPGTCFSHRGEGRGRVKSYHWGWICLPSNLYSSFI